MEKFNFMKAMEDYALEFKSFPSPKQLIEGFRTEYASKLTDRLEERAAILTQQFLRSNNELDYEEVMKVCRKCLIDNFPIEAFSYDGFEEYDYSSDEDEENCIFYSFVNTKERDNNVSNPHYIDFYVPKSFNIAVPFGNVYKNGRVCNVAHKTCNEALYILM